MDSSADNSIEGTDNIVNNNDNNVAHDKNLPTEVIDSQQLLGSQHVSATTTSKRERKRTKYLTDYVCDSRYNAGSWHV